ATQQVSLLDVAWQIGKVTFLPVIIGLSLRYFFPKLVESIAKYINMLANILFLLLVIAIVAVLILSADLRAQLLVGWPAFFAVIMAGVAAVAIGHLLGGPRSDQRAGLAVACLARNIGLAIFIASLAGIAEALFPTFLIYILLGTTIQILYSIWIKRHNASSDS
ncbi:MAG: sodium dependent transporter, partial [Pseudomonadota bacterium]